MNFQLELREHIKRADSKWNLYKELGWDTSTIKQWRHKLLKFLLKDQIKNFDRGE